MSLQKRLPRSTVSPLRAWLNAIAFENVARTKLRCQERVRDRFDKLRKLLRPVSCCSPIDKLIQNKNPAVQRLGLIFARNGFHLLLIDDQLAA